MSDRRKAHAIGGAGFVERIDLRRSRSGRRLWSTEQKGRIVRESLAPGARVADVARKYGLRSQQLTHWRRAARSGRLALVSDEPAEFVEIAIEDVAAHRKTEAKIEIVVGKVLLRLESDAASTRIAEIVAALDRRA
jgi:transposase